MKRKLFAFSKECDLHKELFLLEGIDRYEAILELSARDLDFICSFYKHCDECPLALYFENGNGFCTEFAPISHVKDAISSGAKFVGEEKT